MVRLHVEGRPSLPFRGAVSLVLTWVVVGLVGPGSSVFAQSTAGLRVSVRLDGELVAPGRAGRLVVVALPASRAAGAEPRHRIGTVGARATPIAGVDVPSAALRTGLVVVDGRAAAFPDPFDQLAPGPYRVQAVLDLSRDQQRIDAPGNLYSHPADVTLVAGTPAEVMLELTERVEDDAPADTGAVRFVELRSERLSAFHGRSMDLRAAVVLPRGFDTERERRYPLWISIGGYGTRHREALRRMRPGAAFRRAWEADDAPRLLHVLLDGTGPYGDPYYVDSASNGPYGAALIEELLPHLERRFRGLGRPDARVLDGQSTGGWVALALQIFYPDHFNGAWAFCPDAVDFRAFQRVNVYRDASAYVDEEGRERPSRRGRDGRVLFTMREELSMERVLGRGDGWTRSGRQWGAWNAVYGPRGPDGHPMPLWDGVTGAIDPAVATSWERFDLRLVLDRQWATLRDRLAGKLHVWVGEQDDYFLDEAVRLLEADLRTRDPAFEAAFHYGPGQGHCWVPLGPAELLATVGRRTGARP